MKNKDTFIYSTFNWNIQIPKGDIFVFKITKSMISNVVHFT